jgi:hypothetical protein
VAAVHVVLDGRALVAVPVGRHHRVLRQRRGTRHTAQLRRRAARGGRGPCSVHTHTVILQNVMGQLNSSGCGARRPTPSDSRRACRSASAASSARRARPCASSGPATPTAAASASAALRASPSSPASARSSRAVARTHSLRWRSGKVPSGGGGSAAEAASRTAARQAEVKRARLNSARAANVATADSAPAARNATSGAMAPASRLEGCRFHLLSGANFDGGALGC